MRQNDRLNELQGHLLMFLVSTFGTGYLWYFVRRLLALSKPIYERQAYIKSQPWDRYGGTFGTATAHIITAVALLNGWSPWWTGGLGFSLMLAGFIFVRPVEEFIVSVYGRQRKHGKRGWILKDLSSTNIDESAFALLCALPLFRLNIGWWVLIPILISFLLFWMLDGGKPWPISAVEKAFEKYHGFGVMIDDGAVGVIVFIINILQVVVINALLVG